MTKVILGPPMKPKIIKLTTYQKLCNISNIIECSSTCKLPPFCFRTLPNLAPYMRLATRAAFHFWGFRFGGAVLHSTFRRAKGRQQKMTLKPVKARRICSPETKRAIRVCSPRKFNIVQPVSSISCKSGVRTSNLYSKIADVDVQNL